ncbi:short-chain dehydrogenase [Mycolicibacterium chitae]|uniref:Short-chain dehydrogenase n=1 Tax=Mycolicibacterium chitae TaxID=1792 RepID=A0A448IDE4_MYCCI|nr:SDR family NAD(P)-dependent oxidoreductase [Mycolicibacterium chitae]MCV7107597.1 SDR family NAD(P)-dependent oxidoreductase [Mycolicibacterium chitae]BBZ01605.1 short-chain dehydrogenase [Mycolicibacterium chitae]VEG50441.1 short-chain dehydrogenase [Mycolicibacterium chitae]
MSELRFDGRVAIVTGAGRGIGRGHALLLAQKGARVIVADYGVDATGNGTSSAPADQVVQEIKDLGGEAVACCASVAEEDSATSIIDTAIDTYGRLDIVVNNAGIHDPANFDALSLGQFRSMLDVHFFGALYLIRAAWPHFISAGYGRIVNTVSEAMLGGVSGLTSYASAKGAVYGLTRNLATEGLPAGIRVNAVAPRAYTRLSADHCDSLSQLYGLPEEKIQQVNASMPPELCAPAVAYLAHEDCRLNGEILQVGMGGVARMAFVATKGLRETGLTAESIADNIDTVLAIDGAQVPTTDDIFGALRAK